MNTGCMNYRIKNKYGHCNYGFEDDYVHVYDLYVHKKYRNQGKAKELLQCVIDEIRSTGYVSTIQIVANPTDKGIDTDRLKSFYKRMGFDVYSYYG